MKNIRESENKRLRLKLANWRCSARLFSVIGATIVLVTLSAYATLQAQAASGSKPTRLVSIRVTTAPTVDGKGDDPVWRSAAPLQVVAKRVLAPNIERSTRVSIRSVHTDTHIYFLASWEDATQDISHKTWVWNAEKKAL